MLLETKADLPTQVSQFVEAGSPDHCFLPTRHQPFKDMAVHGEDGHYYCSQECCDAARGIDLSRVEELKKKRV